MRVTAINLTEMPGTNSNYAGSTFGRGARANLNSITRAGNAKDQQGLEGTIQKTMSVAKNGDPDFPSINKINTSDVKGLHALAQKIQSASHSILNGYGASMMPKVGAVYSGWA